MFPRIRNRAALAVLAYVVLHFQGRLRANDEDVVTRGRIIAEGSLANFEGFQQYSCKMLHLSGGGSTVEAALNNGPDSVEIRARVRLAVDGSNAVYVRESDSKPVAGPASPEGHGTGSIMLPSEVWASNGSESLRGSLNFSFGNLGGVDKIATFDNSTWNLLGIFSQGFEGILGKYMLPFLDNGGTGMEVSATPEQIRGQTVTRVVLQSGKLRKVLLVDESRGFIPLEAEVWFEGTLFATAHITDIRECPHGRWFPMRCVHLRYDRPTEGEPNVDTVWDMTVQELNIDQPPTRTDLGFTLAQGFLVSPSGTTTNHILRSPLLVEPSGLSTLLEQVRDNAAGITAPIAARTSNWLKVIGITVVAILAALTWAWMRRQPRRGAAT